MVLFFGRSRQNVTFPLRLGDVLGARLSQRTCLGLRGADRAATRTGCHRHTPSLGAYLNSSGISQPFWPRARQRNCMPIHHSDLRGLRDKWSRGCEKSDDRIVGCRLTTAAALGIEPVGSSLVGTCLPPPLIFRTASRLSTRIVATPMLSSVRRLGVSQGTLHKCRTFRRPKPQVLSAFGRQHWIGILECRPNS